MLNAGPGSLGLEQRTGVWRLQSCLDGWWRVMSCEDLGRDQAGGPGGQEETRESLQAREGTLWPPPLALATGETQVCRGRASAAWLLRALLPPWGPGESHAVEPPGRVSWRRGLGLPCGPRGGGTATGCSGRSPCAPSGVPDLCQALFPALGILWELSRHEARLLSARWVTPPNGRITSHHAG